MLRNCQGELPKSDHLLAYVSFLPHDLVTGGIPHAGPGKRLYFGGAPKSLQMVIAAMKLKDAYSLEGKL